MATDGTAMEQDLHGKESLSGISADLLWLRRECLKRCLFESAEWAEECLFHMPDEIFSEHDPEVIEDPEMPLREQRKINFVQGLIRNKNIARALFMCETRFSHPHTPLKTFLMFFCAYLVYVQKNADKSNAEADNDERSDEILPRLLRKMHMHRKQYPEVFDCWNNYLQGIVSKAAGNRDAACSLFVEAIKLEPRCWPAWEELASMICERTEISFYEVPKDHWYYKMYAGRAYRTVNLLRNAIDVYEYIGAHSLGQVPYIICENAFCSSELQEHSAVFKFYQHLKKIDPFRVENMDVFSDSLYVQSQIPELFILARKLYGANRYAWQTHAVLANYFSASGQNNHAWSSLQTAIKLSPRNHLLYVLLGHLYMELRKPTDAISCYQKAVALNPLDYRAYYGLGQTYEIFKFVDFAIMNYEKSHRCRPNDSRMLVAMGVMYYKLGRHVDAERAYVQAFKCGDVQGNALCKLANLYEDRNKIDKAAQIYRSYLKLYGAEGHGDPVQIGHANSFLSQHCFDNGQFDEAEEFCHSCLQNENYKDKAMALLQKLRMRQPEGAPNAEGAEAMSTDEPTSNIKTSAQPPVVHDPAADRVPTDDEIDDMNIGSDNEEITF